MILKFNVVHVFDVLVDRNSKMQSEDAKETLSTASVASQPPKQTKYHCRNAIKLNKNTQKQIYFL